MLNTDLDAVIPMLLVTLAALATMIAEAFRKPGEHPPMGLFGLIGLVAAAVTSTYLWNRNVVGFGVIIADNFGLFVTLVLVIVGILTIMFSSAVVERVQSVRPVRVQKSPSAGPVADARAILSPTTPATTDSNRHAQH